MFTQFKQKLVARLTKFAYLIVPCGSVIPMMATEIQEGYLVINGQNVYEAEHKRLYDVLAKNNNLSKGSDGKGNYVKLPDPNGRCIELTSNVSFVGKLLAAALPNIIGKFGHNRDSAVFGLGDSGRTYGSTSTLAKPWSISEGSSETYGNVVGINASFSSALYKDLGKLQPSALQLLACIRC